MTTLGHYRPIMRLNITVVTTRSVGVAESKSIHGAFSRTLRRYNADGCLPGQRFSGGRRIFSVTELEAIRHRGRSAQVKTSEGAVLVYGRVSSRRLAKEGHLGQPMGRLREATAGRMVAQGSSAMWLGDYLTVAQAFGGHRKRTWHRRPPSFGLPTQTAWPASARESWTNFSRRRRNESIHTIPGLVRSQGIRKRRAGFHALGLRSDSHWLEFRHPCPAEVIWSTDKTVPCDDAAASASSCKHRDRNDPTGRSWSEMVNDCRLQE